MDGSIKIPFESRAGGLLIRFNNRDILERMVPTFESLAELIKSHQARAVLVDFRGIPGGSTFLERYQLGETAARYLPRIALAVLGFESQLDPGRIGAVVAANRGTQIELFTDPAAAEAWFAKNTQ